jgi:hypothetical protein
MKRQFVIIHAIYQTDSCVTKWVDYRRTFCQNVSTEKKNVCPWILKTNLFVCLVGMGDVLPVSSEVVYWWVMPDCCFMGNIVFHSSSVS